MPSCVTRSAGTVISMTRNVTDDSLGTCPQCNTQIPVRNVLIRYETDGSDACYAECPGCDDPVHPR